MQPTSYLPLPEFEFGEQRAFKQVFTQQNFNFEMFTN